MPAVSLKQKKFMDAVAHNPAFAKQAGVPRAVGMDFSEASKGMKFGSGSHSRADLQKVNSPDTRHGKMEVMKNGGSAEPKIKHKESSMKKMAKGGMAEAKMGKVKTNPGNINGIAEKGKTKGKVIKMSGSTPLGMKKGGKAC